MNKIFKIIAFVIIWLALGYLQIVLWDIFTTWGDSFKWCELTGSVWYVAGMKFSEVVIGVTLLCAECATLVAPVIFIMSRKSR
jgi:hypothetical protein